MASAEGVVDAFASRRETRKSASLAESVHKVAAACQYLVRISLMPHVPDQPVVWCSENRMQGYGQFDDGQRRSKMPTCLRNNIDRLRAKLPRQLFELANREIPEITGRQNPIE